MDLFVNVRIIAACAVVRLTANDASAQSTDVAGLSPSLSPIVLVDATGKAVAKPLTETIVLVTIGNGVVAPASIRAIYGSDGREASGLAAWQAGGSVLFTSPDCTTGAHVYSSSRVGVRATTQIQTPAGISLYVGAVGHATTVSVQSILYDTGCVPVAVRQNGLHRVDATVNLDVAYPPPLSLR